MRVLPSLAEPAITYVVLTAAERKALRRALRGTKGIASDLRKALK